MWDPENYTISAKFFIQLLGIIYFFAFSAFIPQVYGLYGKEGILPIHNFLNAFRVKFGKKQWFYLPTLFWWNDSDRAMMGLVTLGTVLSVFLAFNIYPIIVIPFLYILFLSLKTVGQDFLCFGWDVFLLEVTVNAFFLSFSTVPNTFIWVSLNLLLFRFYLQGGAVKLQSRDPNWRKMTAMNYHYQTQPLPNTIAWFVHKLPISIHKISTASMFLIELVIPFAIFADQEMRLFVFICFTLLQFLIWATGNFSYLNHLSAVLSLILVSNPYMEFFFHPIPITEAPFILNAIASLGGMALILLQLMNLWNHFWPNRIIGRLMEKIYPFHIANRYGIFAVMTTERYEIVIEGSDNGVEWKEYLFRFKPSELSRRPRRISPFQPRLDWQVWFLPFSSYQSEQWFLNFLGCLFKGSPSVLKLLRYNPFPNKPPQYLRVLFYDYKFSDFKTKRELGHWWTRTLVGHYTPTFSSEA